MKILIVDDEYTSHFLLEKTLRMIFKDKDNLEFFIYEDIKEYKSIIENKYDIAFIDLMLKGTTGFELLEKLKTTQPNLYCVAYTAQDSCIDKQYKQTFDYLLRKPFIFKELKTLMNFFTIIKTLNEN